MSYRYSFRLKPDRDKELIEWLESLGEGERSCFIRQALRDATGKTITKTQSPIKSKPPTEVIFKVPDTNGNQGIDNQFNKLINCF